jgi:radical SAM protein with 4Fe4S-binding SPASM domain
MSDDYFGFYPHAPLVLGVQGAAIYDLLSRKVYWVRDPDIARSVAEISNGAPIKNGDIGRAQAELVRKHLGVFAHLGLGAFASRPTQTESYYPLLLKSQADEMGVYRPGATVSVELADECVYDCPWCSSKASYTATACSCAVWGDSGAPLPLEILLSTIEKLNATGATKLLIRGGEPFLRREALWEVLQLASRLAMHMEVHTTGLLIDEQTADRLSRLLVMLSILVPGNDEAAYREVCQEPTAHKALEASLDALVRAGVPFSAKIPITPDRASRANQTRAWITGLGAIDARFLPYLPEAGGTMADLCNLVGPSSPAGMAAGWAEFCSNGTCHPCYDNAYFIAMDGRVTPCSGHREAVASLQDMNIDEILRNRLLAPFEDTARRHVTTCRQCEFRFGCTACLVRTEQVNGTDGRHWLCRYTPETASWL